MFDGILAGARSLLFIVAPIAEQMVREGDDGWAAVHGSSCR